MLGHVVLRRLAAAVALTLLGLSGPALAAQAAGSATRLSGSPGEASVHGDFNGDGFADAAIGVPGQKVGTATSAGAVVVLYGSATGLDEAGAQEWTQDSTDIVGIAEAEDHFGKSVAVGDFNGDGFDDLAVGAPDEDLGTGNSITDAGAVNVIYGSSTGLTSVGNQLWTQDSSGISGKVDKRDHFGFALAAGDFGNGVEDDLAIGVPREDTDTGVHNAGAVNVIYGSSTGLASAGNELWTQDSSGIVGIAEGDDEFGSALAAADLGNGAQADLAVGVPLEDLGSGNSIPDAGAVNVIFGTAGGLASTGNQQWTQDSSSIVGIAETGDQFGYALAGADFGNGTPADLAVGSPFEDLGSGNNTKDAGSVNVIYGGSAGLTSTGNQQWTQASSGIVGDIGTGDSLGFSLAGGDFSGDGIADLAVGVPGETVSTLTDAGAVNVIYGGSSGLTSAGNQQWTQDSAGIDGVADAGDNLGSALAAADFGNGTEFDLAVGTPFEDVAVTSGTLLDAGSINVIYGSTAAGGLDVTGNKEWIQDLTGVPDPSAADNRFGTALA